jgi:hypothetical protein
MWLEAASQDLETVRGDREMAPNMWVPKSPLCSISEVPAFYAANATCISGSESTRFKNPQRIEVSSM